MWGLLLRSCTFACAVLGAAADSSTHLVNEGMQLFAQNEIELAIAKYDQALLLQPRLSPHMWQRGLALYYSDRYQECAAQFAVDISVNPNDTEETIWHLMCLGRLSSLEVARSQILPVGDESRPVMRTALALFAGDGTQELLAEFLNPNDKRNSDNEMFYSLLYLALYNEVTRDVVMAQHYLSMAVSSKYALGTGQSDPMCQLAQVHMIRRGWRQKQEL